MKISEQERLIGDAQVVAAVGGQWGDEGKGKVVDWLAPAFDAVFRGTGGNNAGHTIWIDGKKRIYHLVPSAAMHPGKITVVGNGVVDDLLIHLQEIGELEEAGIDMRNHYVSGNTHLILPQHKLADLLQEVAKGSSKCGTTGRGIGPCYESKARRTGIRMNDLFAPDLEEKIAIDMAMWMPLFRDTAARHPDIVNLKALLHADNQLKGVFWSGSDILNVRKIAEEYRKLGEKIAPHVADTIVLLDDLVKNGKRVLCEGAQGAALDFDHGTYPFVTSSNPTIGGIYTGTGISRVDLVINIMKAYLTRVGGGPLPTELAQYTDLQGEVAAYRKAHGDDAKIRLTAEEEMLIWEGNASDHLLGKAMMIWGEEYGATTGRPRRCGWFDAVQARHTARLNGGKVILTKADVLSKFPEIGICDAYAYGGPARQYDGIELKPLSHIADFPPDASILEHCTPGKLLVSAGWMEDISQVKDWKELPAKARAYFDSVQHHMELDIAAVSNGADREQMIVK
ncbi:MAG: adenylosuccinate synthetase [Nanoarchaeota archaeon]|nr:adenylosuccinate synthetase [Nanoarchaeota archaeon]